MLTRQQRMQIRQMLGEGKRDCEIAKLAGLKQSQVCHFRKTAGLKGNNLAGKKWTAEEEEYILMKREMGMHRGQDVEIAKHLGRSVKTVHDRIMKLIKQGRTTSMYNGNK